MITLETIIISIGKPLPFPTGVRKVYQGFPMGQKNIPYRIMAIASQVRKAIAMSLKVSI